MISVDSDPRAVDAKNELILVTMESGETRNLSSDNPASDSSPMFSPDGETLAFARQAIHGFYADTANVILLDLDSGQTRNITSQWDRSALRHGLGTGQQRSLRQHCPMPARCASTTSIPTGVSLAQLPGRPATAH